MTTAVEQLDFNPGLAGQAPPLTCECGGSWWRNGKYEKGGYRYICSRKGCWKAIIVKDGMLVRRGDTRIKDWRTQH